MYLLLIPNDDPRQMSGYYKAFFEEDIKTVALAMERNPAAMVYKLDSLIRIENIITTHQEIIKELT
jgi:hypothetical protein